MSAQTPVLLRRIEQIGRVHLRWLRSKVPEVNDEDWVAQGYAAIDRCLENYSDADGGYLVEYHQKIYGRPIGRYWASCGMQRLYAPFRAVIARAMGLTDWDMVNCHPHLLLQLCDKHDLECDLLRDYVSNRDKWLSLVMAETKVDRAKAKNLFIRLLYMGSVNEWSKLNNYEGSMAEVDNLRAELRRIGNRICSLYPELHTHVVACPPGHDINTKDPKARTLSLVLGDIENSCLQAARAHVESIGLDVAVLVFDGFMVRDPDGRIDAGALNKAVLDATGFNVAWATKDLDATLPDTEPLNDKIVAQKVVSSLQGRVVVCNGLSFAFNDATGMWSPRPQEALVLQEAFIKPPRVSG